MKAQILNREQGEHCPVTEGCVAISISTPGDQPASLQEGWEAVLRMQFHDVNQPHADIPNLVLFDDDFAKQVHEFITAHLGKDFMIHCDAGVSRSMAIGVFLRDVCGYELQVVSNNPSDHNAFANMFANSLVVRKLKESIWREQLRQE